MTREEMIEYCLETTNAERKRRNFVNMMPRELFENFGDADLKIWVERLQAEPRDAQGNMVAPWERQAT